ncbi:hypothetical protein M3Y97_00853300 [Aphelenchoides bicaudatus]|nr:hypothetical protein M3Y97_00853300 [Aphelenchoides bicaudatus]
MGRKKSQSSNEGRNSKSKPTSNNSTNTPNSKSQNGHAVSAANNSTQNNSRTLKHVPSLATLNRMEREDIVLHKKPFTTIYYAFMEIIYLIYESLLLYVHYSLLTDLKKHKFLVGLAAVLSSVIYYGYVTPGPHQAHISSVEKQVLWSLYWIWLGVLSSIGFGSGLHTFLLYLGPHIARVTLAAFDCKSLNFPSPPYPDDVICPENATKLGEIGLWAIVNKVRLEALMWGAGTALGELPPYFMARAARLSGNEPDDEEYQEYLAFVHGQVDQKETSFLERWKFKLEKWVVSAGFVGILLFASIPNPLFDLAGIICGHSLISFWSFFGATLVGKALIKAHVQMFFVILTFSEHHVETFVNLTKRIPMVGDGLQSLLKEFFNEQKRKLHRSPTDKVSEQGTSILQHLITILIVTMIARFIYDIINSIAKNYHKRVTRPQLKKAK